MKAHELAKLLNGELKGNSEVEVSIPVPVEIADKESTVFILDEKYDIPLSVKIVIAKSIPKNIKAEAVITVKNPKEAFIKTLTMFQKGPGTPLSDLFKIISEKSQIDETAIVFPFVYISDDVEIKKGTVIYPFVFIGENVKIGKNCIIHPHVAIERDVVIKDNVIIHAGAVIGADGFGFERTEKGYVKIPQIGGVIIEDDVEIGANCTIDRATIGNTVIKKGVKLDDQVHIAHNVTVGEHTVMAAQTGIAGSSKIGRWVMMGGQAGVRDHVKVADYTIIMAQSGITKPTESGKMYAGSPARETRKVWKELALLSKIDELFKRVEQLEKKIEEKDDK